MVASTVGGACSTGGMQHWRRAKGGQGGGPRADHLGWGLGRGLGLSLGLGNEDPWD